MKKRNLLGVTLIEMLVVLVIISILSAIVFAVVSKAKGSSHQSVCTSNLRQIGVALTLYAADHDDAILVEAHKSVKEVIAQSGHVYGAPYDAILMNAPVWPTQPLRYGATRELIHCPLDNGWTPFPRPPKPDFTAYGTSYINDSLGGLVWKTFSAVPDPSITTLARDGPTASHGTDGSQYGVFLNCMRYDTHIKHSTRIDCVQGSTPYPGQP